MNSLKASLQISFRVVLWSAYVLWMMGITFLSSLSGDQLPQAAARFPGEDKVLHFLAFTVGAVLLALALRQSTRWSWVRIFVSTVTAISVFGIIDEVHQLFTPKRSGADVGDWVADTLGGIAGAATVAFSYVRFRENSPAPETH